MTIRLQRGIFLLLFLASFLGCKKDQNNQSIGVQDNSYNNGPTYFDFNTALEDTVFTNKLLADANLIDEFNVNSLTRYLLKLASLNDDNFSKQRREELKQQLHLNGTYGLKIGDGPLRLFKASYIRVEKNQVVFTNNIKWLSFPVKKNVKDKVAKLYKVNYIGSDKGLLTVSTIGDSRMYNREAQELRKSLDMMFNGQLEFLGNSQDTNGYLFYDYNVYTHRHIVNALKKIKKSDYYVLFMGLNDFESPFDSVKESLTQAIAVLKEKNPDGHVLLTTLPMVALDAKESKARNSFYKEFNRHIREYQRNNAVSNLEIIDLAGALASDNNYLRSNGVHMSQRGYTVYADLLSKALLKNQTIAPHYTGMLENFNELPLSDQVLFAGNSNATAAGNFSFYNVGDHRGLLSELNPTLEVKAPHRAEMSVELAPYFYKDEVWVGIDFNVPNTYQVDSTNLGSRSMIMQVHSKPNEGESWASYQKNLPFNRPCLGFYLVKNKASYELLMYYGLNGKPDSDYKDLEWSLVARTQIEPDIWNRLDFTIKMSHQNDGYVAAWINQKSLTPTNETENKVYGANMHNEALPYLKFGQYRYWGDSHQHKVFFDNLKAKRSAKDYFFPNQIPAVFGNNLLNATQ